MDHVDPASAEEPPSQPICLLGVETTSSIIFFVADIVKQTRRVLFTTVMVHYFDFLDI